MDVAAMEYPEMARNQSFLVERDLDGARRLQQLR